MRHSRTACTAVFGIVSVFATLGALSGCDSVGGGLAALPFAKITYVQLFDQPNYTLAFSVESALNNPGLVSKINWVFGDGTGFVEGADGRTTITHKYSATGAYAVSAYVFQGDKFVVQIDGTANVAANGSGGDTPSADELPGLISGPNPRDEATSVSVKTKLTWTADADATSHDVYLGKVETDVTNGTVNDIVYQGTQTGTSFDPGGLDPETEYFWRIDERNDAGAAKGTILSFTTAKAPKKAKNFVPADGVLTVAVDQVLQWTTGTNATSHDIYFGTDQTAVTDATNDTPDIFIGNQSATSYDPSDEAAEITGQLLAATDYYWRIDEVGLGGTVKGDTLHFRTADPPAAITSPVPADGATDVDVNTNLSWSAVAAITSFDVYFGTDQTAVNGATRSSSEYKGNQTSKLIDPGDLLGATTYYWRVDTLGSGGTAKGAVFAFTTDDPPAQIAAPFTPANHATNVGIDVVLAWTLGVGGGPTTSVNVYLGTDQAAVVNGSSSASKGNQSAALLEYDPKGLSSATTYFWRIDAVGPGGTTTGQVLRFQTGAVAGIAENPSPANGAKGVALDAVLSWTAGSGATAHQVYFGTSQSSVQSATQFSSEFQGEQAGLTFDPLGSGLLEGNTTYYWRIDEKSAGGSAAGSVWSFTTAPGRAINPDPMDQDTGIALDVQLSWTAGAGAASHNVYFGVVENDVLNATTATVGIYKGNQTGTTWSPPSLLSGTTTYYWRIDEVGTSPNGTTKGLVWKLTTGAGQAALPINPTNGAVGVALSPTLTWTAGAGAAGHDVYFGATQSAVQSADRASDEYMGSQLLADTSFDVIGPLDGNTNYYWRIDELDADDNATKGSIWQFKTATGPASNPTPTDLATGIDINADLSWTAGSGAAGHDVYFGTVEAAVDSATHASAEFKGNQTAVTYDPGELSGGTAYYWRIDEVGPGGTTKGEVWEFTTGAGQAALPISPLNGAVGVTLSPTLTWTAAVGAAAHDIYFGTTQAAVLSATRASAEYQGSQVLADTSFDIIGPLTGNTNYYWRIDELDADDNATKGLVWQFRTGPGKASSPTPADLAAGIDVNADLSWTAGSGTVSHDVYLGTSEAAVDSATTTTAGIYKGNQTATTFEPDELNADTVYYWRIDEVGSGGTTKGEVWEFTTGAGQASNPSPANGQAGAGLNPLLTWSHGAAAASQDVYFGTTSAAVTNATRASTEFQGNQLAQSFNPGLLTGMTFYYWRIDSVTADGTTKGEVWQFRTGPGKATTPTPADYAAGVAVSAQLKWTAGTGAVWHDVYFSTSLADVTNGAPAAFLGRQTGAISAPTLAAGTTYYWRIDEVAANGTTITEGDVWRFTTAP